MHRAAVVQMNSGPDVAGNLARAGHWIEQAVGQGASVVVLPENFALMPLAESDRVNVAEAAGRGPIQAWLAGQARSSHIWLVGGTIPLMADEGKKFYASCLTYGPDGRPAARYNKIHLFDVSVSETESYRESDFFAAGTADEDNLVCVDTPVGRLGLSICYDLRFPELYRTLSRRGAELFCVPSAFTATTGRAHWQTLLRARAIENQAFVLAPGQSGTHINGRETFGHSMIIDPWGEILGQLTVETEGLVVADLNQGRLHAVRQHFPSLQHRRL